MNREQNDLRSRAEKRLTEAFDRLEENLPAESQRLLHELHVHQIELEMQNEELRLAQEELVQTRDRFADLFHNSPVGLLTLDRQGLIVESNRTYAEMMGIPRQYLLGVPFRARVTDRDKRFFDGLLQRCFRKVEGADLHAAAEVQLRRQDGSLIEASIEGSTVGTTEEPELHLSVIDITDRKRLAKMELRHRKLESLGLLAGGIAHDFNNLLTAILGNIALTRMKDLDREEIAANLEKAEQAALQARRLTRQLFTFAHDGSQARRTMDLAALVREAAGLPLGGTLHHIDYDFPADLWPVSVDVGQLGQVVQNLVLNATQSMPEGGRLEIWAGNVELGPNSGLDLVPGRYVRLNFRDEGAGITPEIMEKIFDPYFTTKKAGSGLGLAVSRSIVEAHLGRLSVSSSPDRGTLFEIYLPAVEEGKEKESEPRPVHIPKGWGRILVMDDEENILEVAAAMLLYLGYDPVTATDGRTALELYRQALDTGQPFRAVILDLLLKDGMGGEEVLTELRKINPRIRAIVSSGYSSSPAARRYRDYGFSAAVPKPYRVDELAQALKQTLAEE